MTKILKTAVQYLGLGLLSLGVIIVYASLRGNFNLYIFGTGVLLIVIPIAIYFIEEKASNKTSPKPRMLSDLKQTGIKVPVDLTKCIVKSNNWTAQVEKDNLPKVAFLNEISGHGDKNIEFVESNLSRIEYTCAFNGKRRTFRSPTIAKDEITITLLIEMQKETAVYIDRDDDRYYYFDLEFLDNNG